MLFNVASKLSRLIGGCFFKVIHSHSHFQNDKFQYKELRQSSWHAKPSSTIQPLDECHGSHGHRGELILYASSSHVCVTSLQHHIILLNSTDGGVYNILQI